MRYLSSLSLTTKHPTATRGHARHVQQCPSAFGQPNGEYAVHRIRQIRALGNLARLLPLLAGSGKRKAQDCQSCPHTEY